MEGFIGANIASPEQGRLYRYPAYPLILGIPIHFLLDPYFGCLLFY
jgi:hypothetical protein